MTIKGGEAKPTTTAAMCSASERNIHQEQGEHKNRRVESAGMASGRSRSTGHDAGAAAGGQDKTRRRSGGMCWIWIYCKSGDRALIAAAAGVLVASAYRYLHLW